ncbi:MAG: hypothetical protein NVSMB27_22410 [Ktedonobacteraceae bacterium]
MDEQFLPEPEPTAISTRSDASADAISTTRTNVAGDADTDSTPYCNTCARRRDQSNPHTIHDAYSGCGCYVLLSEAGITPASTARE